MPRGRLSEKLVQKYALEWLRDYYRQQLDTNNIVTREEASVKKGSKRGSGRADGLVAAFVKDGWIFVASMEAKSSKTRPAIKPYPDNSIWPIHLIIVSHIYYSSVLNEI